LGGSIWKKDPKQGVTVRKLPQPTIIIKHMHKYVAQIRYFPSK